MFTLFNKYNRNGDKIKAAKLKCRAAIMCTDKKKTASCETVLVD